MTQKPPFAVALDAAGLTQAQYCRMTGRHRNTVGKWYRGIVKEVPPEVFLVLDSFKVAQQHLENAVKNITFKPIPPCGKDAEAESFNPFPISDELAESLGTMMNIPAHLIQGKAKCKK